MAFALGDCNTILAPNHFGRGMLKTTDGSSSWVASQAGLPEANKVDATAKIHAIAIKPSNANVVFLATSSGLSSLVEK